jgi:hypothetical protein
VLHFSKGGIGLVSLARTLSRIRKREIRRRLAPARQIEAKKAK